MKPIKKIWGESWGATAPSPPISATEYPWFWFHPELYLYYEFGSFGSSFWKLWNLEALLIFVMYQDSRGVNSFDYHM